MHFSLYLLPALAASAVAHRPLHNSHTRLHKERQQVNDASVFVTGASGLGDSQVHARLEISEFQKRPDQWALYIQALSMWQNQSTSDATSYYQIAGIHGVPRVNFDNVEQCSNCQSAWGYCTHDSVLFPAWHRAYVALYEQQLIENALTVAKSYPAGSKRDAMVAAASTLRQPYWDWAAKPASGDVFPSFLTSPQISVEGPNGQITIDNPLYQYEIPQQDVSAMYFAPFINWDQTLRYPNTNSPDAQSSDSSAVAAFNNIQGGLQQQVYGLLTNCPDYLYMSNQASGSSRGSTCSNDIEGIHNTVHTTIGGPGSPSVSGGHMSSLPVASFDAIFWLHHANVDRLIALWQTVNPNSWGASQVAVTTTWTIPAGTSQDANSNLAPFRKDANSFWTTNEVKDFKSTFSYTYPEFVLSDGSQSAINKYIGMLYGSSPSLSASSLSSQVELNKQNNTNNLSTSSSSSSVSSAASSTEATSQSSLQTASSTSAVLTGTSGQANKAPAATSGPSFSLGSLGDALGGLASAVGSGLDNLSGGVSGFASEGSNVASAVASDVAGLTTGLPSELGNGVSGLASGVGNVASHVVSDVGSVATGLPSVVGGLANGVLSGVGDLTGVLLNVTESLLPSFFAPNGSQYEYGCHFAQDVSNIRGAYFVYVFDGEPATNSSDNYLFASNLIGVIAAPATGMSMIGRVATGAVPLTSYLQQQVRQNSLPAMSEEHCVPYLTQNLVWKLVVEGTQVELTNHTGFQAAVYSSTSNTNNGTTAPQWSQPIPQVQVTKGKPGGVVSAPEGAAVLPLTLPFFSSTCSSESASTAAPSTVVSSNVVGAITNSAPAYTSPIASTSIEAPVWSSSAPAYTSIVAPVWSSSAPAYNGTAKKTGWRPTGTGTASGWRPTGTAWARPTGSYSPYYGNSADKTTFSLAGVVALVAVAAVL